MVRPARQPLPGPRWPQRQRTRPGQRRSVAVPRAAGPRDHADEPAPARQLLVAGARPGAAAARALQRAARAVAEPARPRRRSPRSRRSSCLREGRATATTAPAAPTSSSGADGSLLVPTTTGTLLSVTVSSNTLRATGGNRPHVRSGHGRTPLRGRRRLRRARLGRGRRRGPSWRSRATAAGRVRSRSASRSPRTSRPTRAGRTWSPPGALYRLRSDGFGGAPRIVWRQPLPAGTADPHAGRFHLGSGTPPAIVSGGLRRRRRRSEPAAGHRPANRRTGCPAAEVRRPGLPSRRGQHRGAPRRCRQVDRREQRVRLRRPAHDRGRRHDHRRHGARRRGRARLRDRLDATT